MYDEYLDCGIRFMGVYIWASQVVLVVKNLPSNVGDVGDAGYIPGSENTLEEEMPTHSSILAWEVSWTEEAGGLQSMVLQRVGHD